MSLPTSNAKPLKKRVSIACVKCRDRKVKCIPADHEEPPRCNRCREKNQQCLYMTVTAQSEQRERLTTPEQTDYYPPYGSSPVHPPPATPLYPQPPPSVAPIYSHPQQSFSNQPYPTSAYQNADHQNAPSVGFSPPSNMSQAFSYGPPPQAFTHASPIRPGQGTSGNADHQNAPPLSFSPPSNMSSAHQAYSYAPPRQAFPHAQSSSTVRSGQGTSGNHDAHTYSNSTYQDPSAHQMQMNQQFYHNQEWHQGNN